MLCVDGFIHLDFLNINTTGCLGTKSYMFAIYLYLLTMSFTAYGLADEILMATEIAGPQTHSIFSLSPLKFSTRIASKLRRV